MILLIFSFSSFSNSLDTFNKNNNWNTQHYNNNDRYTIAMPIPPNDFNISWDGSNSISVEQYVCLIAIDNYKNKATKVSLGSVTLNTQGSTSNYTLRNSNNDFLRYRISFLDHTKNNYVNLKNNRYQNNITGKTNCDQSDSRPQKIRITIKANDIRKAEGGEYWDLVYLTLAKDGEVYAYDLFYINFNLNSGQIQINQLDDINLGSYEIGNGGLSGEDQFCVYVSPDTSYNINIYDNIGSGEIFKLNSTSQQINYKVYFRTTSSIYYTVINGSTMGTFLGNNSQNCTNQEGNSGGERAYIKIEVSEQQLINSIPDNYKGRIYLTVSPE